MPKRYIAPLEGGRVRLRLLEESDLPMTRAWRNQDHIRRWFIHSEIITPEQHRRWYASYLPRDDDFLFVIEELQSSGRPVGQVSLYNIDWTSGRAEFGRLLIGESTAARGLAREATELLLDYAFTRCALREVELEVFAANQAAVGLYHSCGFRDVEERGDLLKMLKTR